MELTAFTAAAQGSAVQLRWTTASERNSARFEVERSADGLTFNRIGTVVGQGHAASSTSYAFRDTAPPVAATAPLYYRLRQVDTDGAVQYSLVRSVALPDAAPLPFTVYPNPARTVVTVVRAAPGTPVEVTDGLGRVVARATADTIGTALLLLPTGLAPGVYVVKSGGQTQRLVVE